jgi:murein DD-endopeptidase MepM/ murein hydrolase activator NlpD
MTDRPPSPSVTGSGAAQAVPLPAAPQGRVAAGLIGDEPPIALEMEAAPPSPHAVNLRWLAGTMLAGIGGMALVGASLLVALDGQTNFASKAKLAILKGANGGDDDGDHGTKGDKIVTTVDVGGAKQVARLPDTIKVGDREIIKARVFTRVTTAVSLAAANVADEIPPFNPLQIVATAANATRASDDQVADSNADVSMIKHGLSTEDGVIFFPASVGDDEASAQIAPRPMPLPAPGTGLALPTTLSTTLLPHSARGTNVDGTPLGYSAVGLGPFSSLDVKVVPENVAVIGKIDDRLARAGGSERLIIAKHGETFEQILRNNGARADQINQIQAILAPRTKDFSVSVGQKLRLLVSSDREAHRGDRLLRVIVYGDDRISAIAAVDDSAIFRAVVPPAKVAKAKPVSRASQDDEDEDDGGPSLYESLYETALKSNIPRPMIDELVRIFAYDVDFQRKAQQGDSFDLLYVRDEDNPDPDRGDILYASLSIGDEVRKFYRFQTKDDGLIDFFDELGKSAKKFLLRKPMTGGRFSSPFGYRYHPVLGYGRMHTGVDWADKVGTPIFAAGNGTILKASWDSGYGNRVEIQHTNGYVTTYNHMSAYAKGMNPGGRVRQGQVIGFVGSTGLATGPHLHYEVIVNGHFVDPLRIKLPRGRELDGKLLADFNRERQHDDEILTRLADPARIAQNSLN